jgi:hypothetical protein
MIADIATIFDRYVIAMESGFARHEARLRKINADQREANGAALLAIEDALDRLHEMQGCAR